jgi:HB1/ASXL restriction endonuclease-like protein with HTH domain
MNKPWKQAIIEVLEASGEPMTRTEIANAVVSQGLRADVGATPPHTVASYISTSLRNEGAKSPFVRIRRGDYSLQSKIGEIPSGGELGKNCPEEEDDSAGIQAFGVYWKRELVDWKRRGKLLGQQQIGSEPVNLAEQIGIYLLYDGREVIYVGRSVDRPLGTRLFEHTIDRLQARWDRFSWFGLYPVRENGDLTRSVKSIDTDTLIRTLEAVAIESLEPRQNRKRGDDLNGMEYIQAVDPEIEAMRKRAILQEIGRSLK